VVEQIKTWWENLLGGGQNDPNALQDPVRMIQTILSLDSRMRQIEEWQREMQNVTANRAAIVDLTTALLGVSAQLGELGNQYNAIMQTVSQQGEIVNTLNMNQTQIRRALDDSHEALDSLQQAQNLANSAMIRVEENVIGVQKAQENALAALNDVQKTVETIGTNVNAFVGDYQKILSKINMHVADIQKCAIVFDEATDDFNLVNSIARMRAVAIILSTWTGAETAKGVYLRGRVSRGAVLPNQSLSYNIQGILLQFKAMFDNIAKNLRTVPT
jgi:chromosome segregation ATPase